MQNGSQGVSFTNNGGAIVGEISGGGMEYGIDLDYLDNTMMTFDAMGFEHGLDATTLQDGVFLLPEYFELGADNKWHPISADAVPASTELTTTEVPTSPRPETTYLTRLESDCAFQDPNGPWNSPGPGRRPLSTPSWVMAPRSPTTGTGSWTSRPLSMRTCPTPSATKCRRGWN